LEQTGLHIRMVCLYRLISFVNADWPKTNPQC
jgi:hypothetical protein